MALFYNSSSDIYKTLSIGYNPEADSYPLMQTPTPMLVIFTSYLVYVLLIGPSMMKNRPPINLKKTMIVYNGVQVLFSIFIAYKLVMTGVPFSNVFSTKCEQDYEKVSKTRHMMIVSTWWYLVAKVTELLDTIFFVLRKQTRQITFLHVYHHSTMIVLTWCMLKYTIAEQGAVGMMLNSIVHIVMYFYYMVAAMGPQFKKYLWWKKYITTMQIIQFLLIFIYMTAASFSSCGYNTSFSYIMIASTVLYLYLFGDFYRKSFNKNKSIDNEKSS